MNNRPVTDNEVGARSNGYKSGWDESRVDAEVEITSLRVELDRYRAVVDAAKRLKVEAATEDPLDDAPFYESLGDLILALDALAALTEEDR